MRRGEDVLARSTKLVGIVGISLAALLFSGAAEAENAKAPATRQTVSPTSQKDAEPQKAAPKGEVGELPDIGSQLKEAQDQTEIAASRARELDQQTRTLSRDLTAQREAASDAQKRFEERVRSAYKGEDLASASIVLDSLLSGDSARVNTVLNGSLARILIKGRGSIQFNKDSQQALEDTDRQLSQKKADYEKLLKEQQQRAEELRRREAKLKVAIGRLSPKKEQMEERIAQLEVAEKDGEFTRPPASGGGGSVTPEQEREIAQEEIVARPVEEIPYDRYVQIYKAAAKRYGLTEDWFVLAAVGKVESNHGENMGPSGAGALGPMQFLPSTWQEYGVDGNGDGEANIMDPEDAIPAAASYLRAGGAPSDWYAALYTYNRAGWYVREVLGIAETYRRQAGDDEVDPYV
jgi:soluble lytic murein transglycosylase-like protein